MRLIDMGPLAQTLIASLLIAVILLVLRVVVMQRVQSRRQRENRQETERLKSLAAAYRSMAGSFSPAQEPSELLTKLVTNAGRVYQGSPTSSYLANLVFWDVEPRLVGALGVRGLRYSRFVDDVTVSHPAAIGNEEKTWAVAQIYAMLGSRGFKPARQKHAIFNGNASRTIMRVNINERVTITSAERHQVRAMVHQLEHRVRSGENTPQVRQLLSSAIGKIGRIRRLHPSYAEKLRLQACDIQSILDRMPYSTAPLDPSITSQSELPPF